MLPVFYIRGVPQRHSPYIIAHLIIDVKLFIRACGVRCQLIEVGGEDTLCVIAEILGKFLNVRSDGLDVLLCRIVAAYLYGKSHRLMLASDIDSTAVHSCAAEASYGAFALEADTEDDKSAACKVLAQEVAHLAADGYHRDMGLVFLHMNACTVACAALDEYFAVTHTVAAGIAAVAVNDYFA